LLQDGAVAIGQTPQRRPAVGVEAIDPIEGVDFAHDGGDVLVHVAREHAGLKQARLFATVLHRTILVAHGPIGMRFERIAPVEIRTHARHHAHTTLLRRSRAFAEKVAVIEEFAVAVELYFGGIEGENSGDADKDNIHFGRVPVISPLIHVHDRGIVLGQVGLSYTSNVLLPGYGRLI
jgi:hypothetical protein